MHSLCCRSFWPREIGEVVAAPGAADQDQVVFLNLTLATLAARLHDALGERGEAPHVVSRELPAARIGRQRTTRAELAVLDEGPALAFGAEAVVLQRDQH